MMASTRKSVGGKSLGAQNGSAATLEPPSPDAAGASSSPVFRRGRFVVTKLGDGFRSLESPEADRAMQLFASEATKIQTAIYAAVNSRPGCRAFPNAALKRAGRSEALGAVFDFKEFEVEIAGVKAFARVCVTVCVDDGVFPRDAENSKVYSKFWVRFIAQRVPKLDAEGQAAWRAFFEESDAVADNILDAMRVQYERVLQLAINDNRLKVTFEGERFRVFAVEADSPDFPLLFRASQAGQRLRESLSTNAAAVHLVEMALAVMGEPVAEGKDEISRLGKRVSYVIYDSPDAYRGLFLTRRDVMETSYVGLTGKPRRLGDERDFAPASENSANIVTAGLASEIGSHH